MSAFAIATLASGLTATGPRSVGQECALIQVIGQPDRPARKRMLGCQQCYSDREPHYKPRQLLGSKVLGTTGQFLDALAQRRMQAPRSLPG